MSKRNVNFNDKFKKWINFELELDTSEMKDLNNEEEKACSTALANMSEDTGIMLFED